MLHRVFMFGGARGPPGGRQTGGLLRRGASPCGTPDKREGQRTGREREKKSGEKRALRRCSFLFFFGPMVGLGLSQIEPPPCLVYVLCHVFVGQGHTALRRWTWTRLSFSSDRGGWGCGGGRSDMHDLLDTCFRIVGNRREV
jgi:hypothetical protein